MRSVEEQLAAVIDAAVAPEPIRVALTDALGLRCAEEIAATRQVPGFAQAAIDGFAVRAVDVGGTAGLRRRPAAGAEDESEADAEEQKAPRPAPDRALPVVGEVPAGSQKPLRLQPRQAVRVATGAPLPTLADAVLPLEWTDRGRKRVTPLRPVRTGDFVRKAGDDIQPGDVAVRQGTIFGPAQVGLAAAAGRDKVLVYPRPRVTVMSYGLELVDLERDPGLGQVFDIASYAVAAAAEEAGAEVQRAGIINAEPRRMRETIAGYVDKSECIIITGAVGGSGAAAIQEILREMGQIDTTRVAMHPGSVQGFGVLGEERIPVFLLPSNPVSALVITETIVRPLIRRALGAPTITRQTVRARSLRPMESIDGRRGYIRARLMRDSETGEYLVEPLSVLDAGPTHLLAGFAEANAMIHLPEGATHVRPGDEVDVEFIRQRS
ncbi:molybdopterin molybdotransferase [Corynebacterium coyleae]|uniref:Molybdopterin molybdenumtransferase n=1 Tax=Corynebacterium coyleae TaxID=53374 RepID=A0ABX8KW00_9CORY|nr:MULTISPECIES: gephyrin-like molybdotransferase Glp [Corynebacterium]MDK6493923.1 molybdopterin molybdotransferase MoeA [Corynebacterium coyleae]OFO35445.1 molybdopterin molybdenumtransferase [Corynebacterium sp. HMSC075D04]OFT29531.1 molybdopterin molybdenumtransferase [Corynebacterium sp. HMSC08F01]OFT72570.1 molybdopterin molybdenumtransferase [Corynebacterium sp. HMSC05C01]OHO33743.1 molybdopterin molybdenumtransferase [Corynebacterium sp. HMSC034E11]